MLNLLLPKTDILLKKSESIIRVFRKTSEDLLSVNEEINAENTILELQRLEVVQKQKALSDQKNQNEKIAAKIKQFIED